MKEYIHTVASFCVPKGCKKKYFKKSFDEHLKPQDMRNSMNWLAAHIKDTTAPSFKKEKKRGTPITT